MNYPKISNYVQSRYAPRWTDDEITRFIQTRIKYESFFDDRLYCTQEVWEKIAIEARIPENWRRLKKKWSNLVYKYRKIHFGLNKNSDSPVTTTWPFYELIHNYESQRYDPSESVTFSKSEEYDTNSKDYKLTETTNYTIKEPNKIRTYKRAVAAPNIKIAEPKAPLLRIDQSIFKQEPLDTDLDPVVFKIEEDSDTEVYELITSPKQDYPSDPIEYETYDEILDTISPHLVSSIPITEESHPLEQHVNADHTQNKSKSSPLNEKPKKLRKRFLEENETRGEKKLRREITKCTSVFLKFMKMKYGIDPDPASSESDID